jgi:hypothetical protein
MDFYHETHGLIRLDPEARNIKHTHIEEIPDKKIWRISQTLLDQENLNDHIARFSLDLNFSDLKNAPALIFHGISPVAE